METRGSCECRTHNVLTAQLRRFCRDVLAHLGVRHLDFLSLDVEGGELSVLQTLDFDQVSCGTTAALILQFHSVHKMACWTLNRCSKAFCPLSR